MVGAPGETPARLVSAEQGPLARASFRITPIVADALGAPQAAPEPLAPIHLGVKSEAVEAPKIEPIAEAVISISIDVTMDTSASSYLLTNLGLLRTINNLTKLDFEVSIVDKLYGVYSQPLEVSFKL